jgi:hypothetical protein
MIDYYVEDVKDGKYRSAEDMQYRDFYVRKEEIKNNKGEVIKHIVHLMTSDFHRTLELPSNLIHDVIDSSTGLTVQKSIEK